jgi:hypothetical protein
MRREKCETDEREKKRNQRRVYIWRTTVYLPHSQHHLPFGIDTSSLFHTSSFLTITTMSR